MFMNKYLSLGVAAAAGTFAFAGVASAQTELKVDLNDFTVTSSSSTGGEVDTLTFGTDADTAITEILIDGNPVSEFDNTVTFSGQINLNPDDSTSEIDGTVGSGSFTLTGVGGTSIVVDFVNGTYMDSGNGIQVVFFMNGLANLDGDTFEGVDVTRFNSFDNLQTSIIGFYFDRSLFSTPGFTEDASFDFLLTVPSPTAATAGLGRMGVLALGKRRKA